MFDILTWTTEEADDGFTFLFSIRVSENTPTHQSVVTTTHKRIAPRFQLMLSITCPEAEREVPDDRWQEAECDERDEDRGHLGWSSFFSAGGNILFRMSRSP